jgi:type IX secretion system PorP/SprF family membrane protein
MRKILLLILFAGCISYTGTLQAQDIPLFSQKLTNSFVYNPSLAGHTFGSITASYKQNYSSVAGSPKNYFLSVHTPIANHRFGIGANVYQEEVTFLRNMYASGAFAYHLPLDKLTTLSFGLSAEYNTFSTNGSPNFDPHQDGFDEEFAKFQQDGIKDYDFSFGLHFQNRFLKGGIAANRLSTSWIKSDAKSVLSNYYSAFVQGLIPIRGGEDVLEPYLAYRRLSEINNTLDLGIYYTYDNMITAGAAMRSGAVLSGTLAFRFSQYLLIGYSREMIVGNVGGFVGAANEFTIRYDFNNESYKERFSSDYKSSVAYRRKTLSRPVGRPGARSPKQVAKKQKKLAPYSPNLRYQNTKKLSVKTKPGKRSKFSAKKRKKSGGKRRPPKRR